MIARRDETFLAAPKKAARGGPRTTAGKAASRVNGLRHGAFAALPVVAALGERAADFEALREALVAELAPGDGSPLLELLAERAARLWWRLWRIERAESIMLGQYADAADVDALATVNEATRKPNADPFEESAQRRQRERLAPLAPVRVAPTGTARIVMAAHGHRAFVGRLELDAGAVVPLHRDASEEFLWVLEGSGIITIDGTEYAIGAGSIVFMPANAEVLRFAERLSFDDLGFRRAEGVSPLIQPRKTHNR